MEGMGVVGVIQVIQGGRKQHRYEVIGGETAVRNEKVRSEVVEWSGVGYWRYAPVHLIFEGVIDVRQRFLTAQTTHLGSETEQGKKKDRVQS
jgi:hypothetical protein